MNYVCREMETLCEELKFLSVHSIHTSVKRNANSLEIRESTPSTQPDGTKVLVAQGPDGTEGLLYQSPDGTTGLAPHGSDGTKGLVAQGPGGTKRLGNPPWREETPSPPPTQGYAILYHGIV